MMFRPFRRFHPLQYYGFNASLLPFCNVVQTQNYTATPFETGLAASLGIGAALDAFLTGIKQVNYAAIPGNADDPVQDRSWMWQYCSEYGMALPNLSYTLSPHVDCSKQASTSEAILITHYPSRRLSSH